MAEYIKKTDALDDGRVKINDALTSANDTANDAKTTAQSADSKADAAVNTANSADAKSDSTQSQLDTIVIESGTSDAETLQARTNAAGNTFPLLKDRLNDSDAQLADIVLDAKRPPTPLVGAKGDGITDDTSALQAICNYLLSLDESDREVFFPAGTYLYSKSPNWGMNGLKIRTRGEVVFKYSGSDKAFIMDASSDGVRRFYERISVKDIIIEGNANCLSGFYRRNIVRSHFENIEVREIEPTSGKAFNFLWGVSNIHVSIKHSINLHNTTNMAYDGIFITNTDVGGDKTTNDLFINPVIEGASIGIRVFSADNCTFISGTSESNKIYGIVFGTDSKANKVINLAMEANGTADIADAGMMNSIDHCYTQKDVLIQASSEQSKVTGGWHQKITIDAAAKNPVVEDIQASYYQIGGGDYS